MATQSNARQEQVSLQQVAIWTIVAAVLSSLLNVALFLLTQAQFEGALGPVGAFTAPLFAVATSAQVIGGGILLVILARVVKRPITVWRWIAIAFLLISLVQPFVFLDGEPTMAARIILVVMHIIAGVITIFLLTTRTRG